MKEEMIHQKTTPLYHIGEIYEQAEGKKLSPALFKAIDPHLKSLAGYFDTTKMQAFIVSLIFALSYKHSCIGISDIVDYLNCNPIKFLALTYDFQLLFEKKLIQQETLGMFTSANEDLSESEFVIPSRVSKSILENTAIINEEDASCKNEIELLSEVYKLCRKREDNEVPSEFLISQIEFLLTKHQDFPLVQKIEQLELN